MDKKLTYKEIIKALESEIHLAEYVDNDYCSNVNLEIIKSALDLITCQQVKIDEFMKETAVTTLIDDAVVYTPTLEDYNKFKKKFKSEAVKEVFEKLNKKAKVGKIIDKKFPFIIRVVTLHDIKELKKEMVGENNSDE